MKRFVRGQFGRLMSLLLMVLFLLPTLLGPLALPGYASVGGYQSILILPLQTVAENTPFNLSTRILQEVMIAMAGQTGVSVRELTKNSPTLQLAMAQMDETEKAKLLEQYNEACDVKTAPASRTVAAGALVRALNVDAIVYGAIDKYEFTSNPDPRQSYIHVSAMKYSVDADSIVLTTPIGVIGQSRRTPAAGSQASYDNDAISSIGRNLAMRLLGGRQFDAPESAPKTVQSKPVKGTKTANATRTAVIDETAPTPVQEEPRVKPSKMRWLLPVVIAVAGAVLLSSAGKGEDNGGGGGLPATGQGSGFAYADSVELVLPIANPTLVQSYEIWRADQGMANWKGTRQSDYIRVRTLTPSEVTVKADGVHLRDISPYSNPAPAIGELYSYQVYVNTSSRARILYTITEIGSGLNQTLFGPGVPSPVKTVRIVHQVNSQLTLGWDMPSYAPDFLAGFLVQIETTTGQWSTLQEITDAATRQATITIPAASTVYRFRVLSFGVGGYRYPTVPNSAIVSASFVLTPVAPGAPRAEQQFSLPDQKDIYIVSWDPAPDVSVIGYELYRLAENKGRLTPASISNPLNKLPLNSAGRRGRGRGFDSLRPGRQAGMVKIATITGRTQTQYIDKDLQAGWTYTYALKARYTTVVSDYSGMLQLPPLDNTPGDVTDITLNGTITPSAIKFNWTPPVLNADGVSTMSDWKQFDIYRSTSIVSNTTQVNSLAAFTKIGSVPYVAGQTDYDYTDSTIQTRMDYTYAIKVIDVSGKESPGVFQAGSYYYNVVQDSRYPTVKSIAITPDQFTAPAGSIGQQLTVTATGTDNQSLPNVAVTVTVSAGAGGCANTLSGPSVSPFVMNPTGADGKATCFWIPPGPGGVGSGTLTISVAGTAVLPVEIPLTITTQIPTAVDLTINMLGKSEVQARSPNADLTNAASLTASLVEVTLNVRDSAGTPIPNQTISLFSTDPEVAISTTANPTYVRIDSPTYNGTVTGTTNALGELKVKVCAGTKVGTVIFTAGSGVFNKQATLDVTAGPVTNIEVTVLSPFTTTSVAGAVTVTDAGGNPVMGRTITLFVNTQAVVLSSTTVTTGSDGVASFTITPVQLTNPITFTLTAVAGSYSSGAMTLKYVPPSPRQIATYTMTVDSSRIYFSADPDDQLSNSVVTSSVVKVHGADQTGSNAANEVVKFTTTKGHFTTNGNPGLSVSSDARSLSGTLDANGDIYFGFIGRQSNGEQGTELVLPTAEELGTSSIIAENQSAKTELINAPVLVGPPNHLRLEVIPVALPEDWPKQNDLWPVLFQDKTMTIRATATDMIDQPVVSGMPLWFAQSYRPYDAAAANDYDGVINSGNFGGFGSSGPFALTDDTGKVSTGFASRYSGLYDLYAFALKKNANNTTLDAIKNLKGYSQSQYEAIINAVKDANLLSAASSGGTVVTSSLLAGGKYVGAKVLSKTYAFYNKWTTLPPSSARINCDGTQTSRITFTATDEDNKKVLSGVPFKVSAWISANDWVIGTDEAVYTSSRLELENNTVVTPLTILSFNSQAQAYVLSRGNLDPQTQRIGYVKLVFDNMRTVQPLTETPYLLTHYGPPLSEATNKYVSLSSTVLAGASDAVRGNPGDAQKSLVISAGLFDIYGNPYPAGYKVKMNDAVVGETDLYGLFTVTYNAPDLNNVGNPDSYTEDLTFGFAGENAQGPDTVDFDPQTITVERPNHGDVIPVDSDPVGPFPFSTDTEQNRVRIVAYVEDQNNGGVLPGYPIDFKMVKLQGADDAVLELEDGTPSTLSYTGSAFVNAAMGAPLSRSRAIVPGPVPAAPISNAIIYLNPGKVYGKVRIWAYYDKNQDGIGGTNELIGETGVLTVGLPAPEALKAESLNTTTIKLTWKDGPDEMNYQVDSSTNGVAWTPLTPVDTLLPADTSEYTVTGLQPGTRYYFRVRGVAEDTDTFAQYQIGYHRYTFSDWSTAANITLPNTPGGPNLSPAIDAVVDPQAYTKITVIWQPVAGVTGYRLERSLDGVTWAPPIDFGPGVTRYDDATCLGATKYYYRVSASSVDGGMGGYSIPTNAASAITIPFMRSEIEAKSGAPGTHSIILRYNAATGTDVTGYYVYRGGVRLATIPGQGTSTWTDTSCADGETYTYYIVAYNGTGVSNKTDDATATVEALPAGP